jgi:hypothetical protein
MAFITFCLFVLGLTDLALTITISRFLIGHRGRGLNLISAAAARSFNAGAVTTPTFGKKKDKTRRGPAQPRPEVIRGNLWEGAKG